MRSRRSVPELAIPDRNRAREAATDRSDLATALRRADLDATAVDHLDDTRHVLVERLVRHSDDYGATTALKALDTFTADARTRAQSGAPAQLRHQGASGTHIARRWLHLGGAE